MRTALVKKAFESINRFLCHHIFRKGKLGNR